MSGKGESKESRYAPCVISLRHLAESQQVGFEVPTLSVWTEDPDHDDPVHHVVPVPRRNPLMMQGLVSPVSHTLPRFGPGVWFDCLPFSLDDTVPWITAVEIPLGRYMFEFERVELSKPCTLAQAVRFAEQWLLRPLSRARQRKLDDDGMLEDWCATRKSLRGAETLADRRFLTDVTVEYHTHTAGATLQVILIYASSPPSHETAATTKDQVMAMADFQQ